MSGAAGEIYSGRFAIGRQLGSGGMGVVYEAVDLETERRIALKTLHKADPQSLYLLKREFRALSGLSHRNLVRLGELHCEQQHWYFTMELVDGSNFRDYVRGAGTSGSELDLADTVECVSDLVDVSSVSVRAGPSGPRYDEERLRHALLGLAEGLQALHAAGRVHRDVKPSNVLVESDGRVVLLDFGLSRSIAMVDADSTARDLAGTVAYMAPEQAGCEEIGPPADWYAVGVMLFEALTGTLPFVGAEVQVLTEKRRRESDPSSSLIGDVPPDLDALCQWLLRREPRDRPSGEQVIDALRRSHRGPAALPAPETEAAAATTFVGRTHELAVLASALDRCTQGESAAVLVVGEPGIGKTALVERFLGAQRATQADVVVLRGRCSLQESLPYNALDGVIDELTRYLRRMDEVLAAATLPFGIQHLASMFPVLHRIPVMARLVTSPRTVDDEAQLRARGALALRQLLESLAARCPVVVFIDDVQWADAESRWLLDALVRPGILGCLMVMTARGDAAAVFAGLERLGEIVEELRVPPLLPDEATALAEGFVDSDVDPAGARGALASIVSEAKGHPLFLQELVRFARLPGRTAGLPVRLEDALWNRITELEPVAREVLEVVAVAGVAVELPLVAAVVGVSAGQALERALDLRGRQLVRCARTGDEWRIDVFHDRVGETLLERVALPVQCDLHARIGAALEAAGDADPERLAVHFAAAGDRRKAAAYAVIAAGRAEVSLAFERAARLLRRALELAPPDAPEGHELRVRLAEALANLGRGQDAAEVYLSAATHASADEQVELQRRAAEQLLTSGRIDEGLQIIRTVLASVGMHLPQTPRRALASLVFHRARLRLGGLRVRLRDPAEIPRAALSRIDVCWSVSIGLAIVDPLRAADFQARHLRFALDAGDPYRTACALAAEAAFSAALGGRTRARTTRLVREADDLARQVGDARALGYAVFAAGSAEYLAGGWHAARGILERADSIFRDRCAGVTWCRDTGQLFALECLWYQGDVAELARRVPTLIEHAEARGNVYAATNLQIGLPNAAWLVADDVEGARRRVRDAMIRWSPRGFHVQHVAELLALVQADLYAGEGLAAYDRFETTWPVLRGAVILRVQLTRIATYHQRARAALAAAATLGVRSSQRRRLIAEARRHTDRIAREQMPWADALAALLRAGADRLAGDDARAATELTSAIERLDASGMALYAAAARLRLGALQGGDTGTALAGAATAALRDAGIRRPDRMADLLAPALGSG